MMATGPKPWNHQARVLGRLEELYDNKEEEGQGLVAILEWFCGLGKSLVAHKFADFVKQDGFVVVLVSSLDLLDQFATTHERHFSKVQRVHGDYQPNFSPRSPKVLVVLYHHCLLYTSPSPRD